MSKVWVDLTHPFSAEIPRWPYFDKPAITSKHSMAKGGVLTQNISCSMHTGTHCDVPRHVMEMEFDGKRSRYLHEFPVDAFCGDAACLDLHFVKRWELIEDEQLDKACRDMGIDPDSDYLEGKGVILCTGMNLKSDDSKEYYHYSCGTGAQDRENYGFTCK